ncbi:MAG: hypothetical protein SOW45_08510 [Prevotella sp.]|nr:hypothetical protein [Prevotella sp.]
MIYHIPKKNGGVSHHVPNRGAGMIPIFVDAPLVSIQTHCVSAIYEFKME